jgi:hypothetical protein
MQLLEAGTPEEATNFERTYLGLGLDGVKLFTGSFKGENNPVVIWTRPSPRRRSTWLMPRASRCSLIRRT